MIPGRVVAAGDGLDVEVMRLRPALVDKVGGQVEIALLAGGMIELDQRQLDLLMAAVTALLPFLAAKNRGDIVGVATDHVEQRSLPGRLVVSDAGLDQVPGAVQLVVVAQVRPTVLLLDCRVVGVDIAVGLLRRHIQRDDLVYQGVERRIRVRGQAVGCGLYPLGHVRIPKIVRYGLVWLPVKPHSVDAASGLALVVFDGNRAFAVCRQAGRPEDVVDRHGGEGHRGVRAPYGS